MRRVRPLPKCQLAHLCSLNQTDLFPAPHPISPAYGLHARTVAELDPTNWTIHGKLSFVPCRLEILAFLHTLNSLWTIFPEHFCHGGVSLLLFLECGSRGDQGQT